MSSGIKWFYWVLYRLHTILLTPDSEDDGMSNMWSSYLRSQEGEEAKSKEARAEQAYAKSRGRAIMTSK